MNEPTPAAPMNGATAAPPPAEAKTVKPLDAERRKAATEAQAARRLKARLKKAKSRDEMIRLLGEHPDAAPNPPKAAPDAVAVAAPAIPAPAVSEAERAELKLYLAMAFTTVAAQLKDTPYRINVDGKSEGFPLTVLVDGTSPLAEKYLPAFISTPEGRAASVAAAWLIPATVVWMTERAEKKKAEAKAMGQAVDVK